MLQNCLWFGLKAAIWGVSIWLVGIGYSFIILIWMKLLIYILGVYFLDLVPLKAMDESWLLDYPLNKCHPACFVTFDKMNSKLLKSLILERLVSRTIRMQCWITTFLGSIFMKKLPWNEAESAIQILDENEFSLHNEKDLSNFLETEINKVIPLDTPQYRMWIYENYSDEESVIIFKEHHVMADGIGILEIIMLITDEFKPEAMIDFRPTSWFNQLILYLISPIYILYYLFPIVWKRADKFSITNTKLSGEKKLAIGKKFPLDDLKRSAKDLGVSINDICSAALSAGMTEYLKEIGDEKIGPMTVLIPVNLRKEKVRKPEDVKLQNNFIIVLIDLIIGDPIEKEIKRLSALMNNAKKSIKPLATMFLQQIIVNFFPLFITRPLMDYTASKSTLAFSNVPGFKTHLRVNGCKANSVLFFTPWMSKIGLGVSMISHVDHFRIGISSDKLCVENVDSLLEKIENNIQKCINLDGNFNL